MVKIAKAVKPSPVYKRCGVCGGNTFDESTLNFKASSQEASIRDMGDIDPHNRSLESLGDWAVLCTTCSKTYRTTIQKK